ncbi:MAG: hypothetical protein JXR95_07345 [Deltaproteobacteria bacterium]|nr:hypothetical protein [Deltaproteobacteria bacterium]
MGKKIISIAIVALISGFSCTDKSSSTTSKKLFFSEDVRLNVSGSGTYKEHMLVLRRGTVEKYKNAYRITGTRIQKKSERGTLFGDDFIFSHDGKKDKLEMIYDTGNGSFSSSVFAPKGVSELFIDFYLVIGNLPPIQQSEIKKGYKWSIVKKRTVTVRNSLLEVNQKINYLVTDRDSYGNFSVAATVIFESEKPVKIGEISIQILGKSDFVMTFSSGVHTAIKGSITSGWIGSWIDPETSGAVTAGIRRKLSLDLKFNLSADK